MEYSLRRTGIHRFIKSLPLICAEERYIPLRFRCLPRCWGFVSLAEVSSQQSGWMSTQFFPPRAEKSCRPTFRYLALSGSSPSANTGSKIDPRPVSRGNSGRFCKLRKTRRSSHSGDRQFPMAAGWNRDTISSRSMRNASSASGCMKMNIGTQVNRTSCVFKARVGKEYCALRLSVSHQNSPIYSF